MSTFRAHQFRTAALVAMFLVSFSSSPLVAAFGRPGEPERGIHTSDGRPVQVEENPDFSENLIRCRLCEIAVDGIVRQMDGEHSKCLSDSSSSPSKCPLPPPGFDGFLSELCTQHLMDWFPAVEMQDTAAEIQHGDSLDEEQEMVPVDTEGPPSKTEEEVWPEGIPEVPPGHLTLAKRLCLRLFFPSSAPQLENYALPESIKVSGAELAKEAASYVALRYEGSTAGLPPLFKTSIFPMLVDKCDAYCEEKEGTRSEHEPPAIRGFSMSMKPLGGGLQYPQ